MKKEDFFRRAWVLNKSARSTPFVLSIVVTALLLVICMTGTILFASLSVNQSKTVTGVGVLGTLSATVGTGTITVSNDMDCVLRVAPLASGITFSSSQWYLQDNGWYYYYRVIKQADSAKTVTLTGATAANIMVELAQAQYITDATTGAAKAGFITEWASRNLNATSEVLGQYTSDGLNITYGNQANSAIVMYSGHDQTRRVPSSSYSTEDTNCFMATRSGSYYVFDKINLSSGSSYETITSSNAITLYNNTDISVVYMIQIIDGGAQPNKSSAFSNGNWTTYIDTTPDATSRTFTLASSSTATSGYSTYFVSSVVSPGQYVDLTSGTDNQLYFDSVTDTQIPIRISVTSIDTMTFYNNYLNSPNLDGYLAWLRSLDSNYSGATFYSDFVKIISN